MALTGLTISDFNPDNLNAFLSNSSEAPALQMTATPYGQVQQVLMDREAECWRTPVDFVIVWTQPHLILPEFNRALRFEPVSQDKILNDVDQFCSQILLLRNRTKTIFVPLWVPPAMHRGLGVMDASDPRGIANLTMRINLRLCERLQDEAGVYTLNTASWVQATGEQAFNTKLWYMAKVAFGNKVQKLAARDIKIALNALSGGTKKLIVLDLDNTLWGGVVGDVGWQGLTIGGHDPAGEAFVDFQQALKVLRTRGFLLALSSKNEESIALEAIENHPEMVLCRDDFASWRINWQDKAQNLLNIINELNLGSNSVVFIDDNPAERARVAESLPEVTVPDWPEDPLEYVSALASLGCFDSLVISEEDLKRAEMYQAERQRNAERTALGSLDEWLKTLNMNVRVEPLAAGSLPRAAQLVNKTNQMNLRTRRLTEAEFQAWSEREDVQVWVFHVDDRFGSQGLIGVMSVQKSGQRLKVVDFILSCRVMGRNVEDCMLAIACEYAQSQQCSGVDLEYLETDKNHPCLSFLERTALQRDESVDVFHWESSQDIWHPEHINLQRTG